MMTALSSDDQRTRGEQLGADRYLVKSQVGIEDVVRTVHDVLGDNLGSTQANSQQTTQPVAQSPQSQPQSQTQPEPSYQSPIPANTQPPTVSIPPKPEPSQQPSSQPQNTPSVQASSSSTQNTQSPSEPAPEPQATSTSQQDQSRQSVELPQPTAPFSTPRPANLGDRVIQPISRPDDDMSDQLASKIERELNGIDGVQSFETIQSQPAPQQSANPEDDLAELRRAQKEANSLNTPAQKAPEQQYTQPSRPQPQPNQDSAPRSPDLNFEETPRPAPPQF
jgi:hypothetical protein